MEALLRGHIQKSSNCNFIYAGSERHMMQEMFLSSARPFYRSADLLELEAIPKEIYVQFVTGHFRGAEKKISEGNVAKVYDFFKGHTFYMQKTFNEVFADTSANEECSGEKIKAAISVLVDSYDTIFREILSNVPEKQKELLYAIAIDGEASSITSTAFIRRHRLSSASSVQSAVKKLLEKDLVTVGHKVYSISDRFFALWLATQMGPDDPLQSLV